MSNPQTALSNPLTASAGTKSCARSSGKRCAVPQISWPASGLCARLATLRSSTVRRGGEAHCECGCSRRPQCRGGSPPFCQRLCRSTQLLEFSDALHAKCAAPLACVSNGFRLCAHSPEMRRLWVQFFQFQSRRWTPIFEIDFSQPTTRPQQAREHVLLPSPLRALARRRAHPRRSRALQADAAAVRRGRLARHERHEVVGLHGPRRQAVLD